MLDGLAHELAVGRGERDVAGGEELERGLELGELERGARMQLGLVLTQRAVVARQLVYVDGEGHRARGEHVDHPVVAQGHLELHLLQEATIASRRSVRLGLGLGARARYLARRPDGGGGVRLAQAHVHHAVLLLVLDVQAEESDAAQIEVTLGRVRAHHVVDVDLDEVRVHTHARRAAVVRFILAAILLRLLLLLIAATHLAA